MIQLLQTKNFRMLRSNSVALQPFQVLVGQNASGKSTFLGALQLLGDILKGGVPFAVERLAPSFYDLCFDITEPISLAVEMTVPGGGQSRALRYEIEVGIDRENGLRVLRENLFILPGGDSSGLQASLFGSEAMRVVPIHKTAPRPWRKVVSKTEEGRDYFRDESTDWNNMFRFGLEKAALGSLPEDPDRFPLSIAARNALRDGVRTLVLDAEEMRSASPPGGAMKMALNGSNLPHVVRSFQKRDPILFEQWVQHVGRDWLGVLASESGLEDQKFVLFSFPDFDGLETLDGQGQRPTEHQRLLQRSMRQKDRRVRCAENLDREPAAATALRKPPGSPMGAGRSPALQSDRRPTHSRSLHSSAG